MSRWRKSSMLAAPRAGHPVISAAVRAMLLLLLLAAACVLLSWFLPAGADFYNWYYLVPRRWLGGETRLYDAASTGFYLPPWGLWPLLLPALLELPVANAIFVVMTATTIGAVSYRHALGNGASHPWLTALLSCLAPYSLVCYFTGTSDGIALLGVAGVAAAVVVGRAGAYGYRGILEGGDRGTGEQRSEGIAGQRKWEHGDRGAVRALLLGASAMLLLVRPQQGALLVPGVLVAVRHWDARRLGLAAVPAALVLAGSVFTSGIDWPLRWAWHVAAVPPSANEAITTYSALERLGVPLWASGLAGLGVSLAVLAWIWRGGLDRRRFDVLLALNAVLTPYMRSPSYVVLLALPWAGLAARRPWLAAAASLVMLPNLVIPVWWQELGALWPNVPFVDVLFPPALLWALWWEGKTGGRDVRNSGSQEEMGERGGGEEAAARWARDSAGHIAGSGAL